MPARLGAQEALQTAVQGDRAYEARQPSPTDREPELRAGPVELEIGASFATEWTDNINLSDDDPLSELSLRPQVDLRALWAITDRASLDVATGLGYTFYLEGHRKDRLFLDPNSEIALDIGIKDLLVTAYEHLAYSDDPTSEGGLPGGEEDYAKIENTAGLRGTWFLDDWQAQAGYAHYNYWSLADEFSEMDRASEQVFARGAYAVAAESRAGLEFSGSFTDYSEAVRDDYQSLSAGPFFEWKVTEYFQLALRGGLVRYDFDEPATGPGLGTFDSWYAGINASHHLTENISHSLGVSREAQVSLSNVYEEIYRADYSVRWSPVDPATWSMSLFYEHSTGPGDVVQEQHDQFGVTTGLSYQFSRRFIGDVSYRFTRRTSEIPGQDYLQNLVAVGISYRL